MGTYTEHEVKDMLYRIYDDFDLKDVYEAKVLDRGIIRNYDDVDAIMEAAQDLFLEEYLC